MQQATDELTNRLGRPPHPRRGRQDALHVPDRHGRKLVDDVHRATVLNYESLVLEGDAEEFLTAGDAGPEDAISTPCSRRLQHQAGKQPANRRHSRQGRMPVSASYTCATLTGQPLN